jgi:flagellar hook protein FlgE
MSGFSTALSGLLANTTALNVTGDNLANMNTQGFKANSVHFEDAMLQASESLQVGAGVSSTNTTRSFLQGGITNTGGNMDAAIQGNGFFVINDVSSGATQYTRDGTFSLNAQGQLVTKSGSFVQGWSAVNGVLNASGATSAITVPLLSALPPVATTTMSINANLNANAQVDDTFSVPVQVVDSLGQPHTLTVKFTNTAPGAWKFDASIPGQDVTGGTAGTPSSVGTGTVKFDSSGKLTAPAAPGTVALANTAGLADGAADFAINFNLYDAAGNGTLTGYAQASSSSGTTQDGSQAANVTGVSLQNGGLLVATFSNGKQISLAQVAVAAIANPNTLIGTSNNNYTLGTDTITPSVGAANTGGRGSILGGALEASNVDMATEFTNLIVFQRGYEANSKVITSINQMQQTLLAINP